MNSGPISRSRKKEKQYILYKKSRTNDTCIFCNMKTEANKVVEEYPYFWVIENRFGYEMWDGCGVDEHLMIVPKRHIDSLSEMNDSEKLQYIEVVSQYEGNGYSIYSRANQNNTKSVPHQHTHFIRVDNKRKKYVLYLNKPHIAVYR